MTDKVNKSNSKTKDIIDAATGLVKAVPVYDDLLQPSIKEVGKSLETIAKSINIALSPIKGLVWGYDQLEDFLSIKVAEKLKGIPPEKICTPKPNIAGPALEALKYTGHEEELREMYANLLATSLDKETTNKAHPSFVEIIKQLNPQEARLLKYLSGRCNYPEICEYQDIKEMKRSSLFVSPGLLSSFHHELVKIFFDLCNAVEITGDKLSCLDNLKRLQLISFSEINEFSVGEPHTRVCDCKVCHENNSDTPVNEIYHTESLDFTNFGQLFVEVCIMEKCN